MRSIVRTPCSSLGRLLVSSFTCAICNLSCAGEVRQPQPDNLRGAPTRGRGHSRKSSFEIGDKVVRIFKANMETHRRPARPPFGGGPVFGAVKQYGQAFEAAP